MAHVYQYPKIHNEKRTKKKKTQTQIQVLFFFSYSINVTNGNLFQFIPIYSFQKKKKILKCDKNFKFQPSSSDYCYNHNKTICTQVIGNQILYKHLRKHTCRIDISCYIYYDIICINDVIAMTYSLLTEERKNCEELVFFS